MPIQDELTLFEKVLLATDGTVTDLITLYAGESIRVRKLEQRIAESDLAPHLDCAEPEALWLRTILLSGASRNYLYAESQFVVSRLPPGIRQLMTDTDRPIGLLWKEARLETFREILSHAVEPCAEIAHHFGVSASTPFVSRKYLVYHGGRPLGLITERWPLHWFR